MYLPAICSFQLSLPLCALTTPMFSPRSTSNQVLVQYFALLNVVHDTSRALHNH